MVSFLSRTFSKMVDLTMAFNLWEAKSTGSASGRKKSKKPDTFSVIKSLDTKCKLLKDRGETQTILGILKSESPSSGANFAGWFSIVKRLTSVSGFLVVGFVLMLLHVAEVLLRVEVLFVVPVDIDVVVESAMGVEVPLGSRALSVGIRDVFVGPLGGLVCWLELVLFC